MEKENTSERPQPPSPPIEPLGNLSWERRVLKNLELTLNDPRISKSSKNELFQTIDHRHWNFLGRLRLGERYEEIEE